MKILTGIDMPFEPSCGSMILCDDIYSYLAPKAETRFLSLKSDNKSWSTMQDIVLLSIEKVTDQAQYTGYVNKLYNEVLNHVESFSPDVIHIQHLSFGMALAFAQVQGVPKVAICHGTDILYSIGNDFHRTNVIKVCESADVIVFPSQRIYLDFQKIIGINVDSKARVVYWGIPQTSKQLHIETHEKTTKLLYAGRLTEDKGVDTIIKSLKLLPPLFQLTIIGSGVSEPKLRTLAKDLDLENRIRFEAFKPRSELWNEFHKYDALIISTQEIESFCLVAIEAQLHSLPVIYSRTSALIEVLEGSGINFTPLKEDELAESVLSLFQSGMYSEYQEKSIKNANKFSIDATASKLLQLSSELLTNRAAA